MGGGVAAHVHNALWGGIENHIHDVGMHSCAGRVCDDDVGTAMLGYEVVGQDVLHVAGEEFCVVDAVDLAVHLCVVDGLRHILYAHHLLGLVGHKVGNRPRSRVEVVNGLVALQVGKLPCHAIQLVGLFGVGLVEALCVDLESQVLHGLHDVVLAFERDELQVAEGVVAFLVVHIKQRTDLREMVSHVLKQFLGFLLIGRLIVVELYEHHPLARVGVAEHDVAQESFLPADVEKGDSIVHRVVIDVVAYLVVQIVHEPAFLYGIDFVECSRDVESYGTLCQSGIGWESVEFLAGIPPLVGTAVFGLVAIFLGFDRTQDGAELGQFHLSDSGQLIHHLLLLGLELVLIGQVLPFAASTNTEVAAHRFHSLLAVFHKSQHVGLGVILAFLLDPQIHHIARHGKCDKHCHVVHVGHGLALGGHGLYSHIFQYRITLSCHNSYFPAKLILF